MTNSPTQGVIPRWGYLLSWKIHNRSRGLLANIPPGRRSDVCIREAASGLVSGPGRQGRAALFRRDQLGAEGTNGTCAFNDTATEEVGSGREDHRGDCWNRVRALLDREVQRQRRQEDRRQRWKQPDVQSHLGGSSTDAHWSHKA